AGNENVIPTPAIELISAVTAEEDVAAGVAFEVVVPTVTDEHIISTAAASRVFSVATEDEGGSCDRRIDADVVVAVFPVDENAAAESEGPLVAPVDLYNHFALRRSALGHDDRIVRIRAFDLHGFL